MRSEFNLLIFDWDGTLMNSQAGIVQAMALAFSSVGREQPNPAQISAIIGLSLDEAIFRLAPKLSLSLRQQIAIAYRENFSTVASPAKLFAGVIESLDYCQSRGFVLAIATGKSQAGLNQALQQTGISDYFTSIRTADRCQSKPAPEMLEEILLETGVAPNRALLIGDTSFDLQMAANARAAAAAACYGAHPRHLLAEHRPLFYLDNIAELPAKLSALENNSR